MPGPAVGGRGIAGGLLVVAAVGLAVVLLVLIHGTPTVERLTRRYDDEGSPQGGAVLVQIRCIPVAAGTSYRTTATEDSRVVTETPNGLAGDADLGFETGEANAFCDRARDARIAWALQAGLGAAGLFAGGLALLRRRRTA